MVRENGACDRENIVPFMSTVKRDFCYKLFTIAILLHKIYKKRPGTYRTGTTTMHPWMAVFFSSGSIPEGGPLRLRHFQVRECSSSGLECVLRPSCCTWTSFLGSNQDRRHPKIGC